MGASKSGIKAGEGYVELLVKDDKFKQGLKAAGDHLRSWGAQIGKLGAGIAGAGLAMMAPFLYGANELVAASVDIASAARNTGLSFAEVQRLAAGLGLSLDDLGTSTRHMSHFLGQVASGSASANAVMQELGLSFADLRDLSQNDRMLAFADALSRVGDEGRRLDLTRTVMGRGAQPNVTGGAKGIMGRTSAREEFRITDEDVGAARNYSRTMGELNAAQSAVWRELGAAALPILEAVTTLMTEVVSRSLAWARANRPLLTVIFAIGGVLAVVGTVLGVVAGGLVAAGLAFAGLSFALVPLAILGGIGIAIAAVGATIAGIYFGIKALWAIFPMLGDVVRSFWGGVMSYLEPVTSAFGRLFETISGAMGGISDSLVAGDFEGAFEIATLGLTVIWERFKNFWIDAWGAMKFFALQAFDAVAAGIRVTVLPIIEKMTGALADTLEALGATDKADLLRGGLAELREFLKPAGPRTLESADRTDEREAELALERAEAGASIARGMAEVERQMAAAGQSGGGPTGAFAGSSSLIATAANAGFVTGGNVDRMAEWLNVGRDQRDLLRDIRDRMRDNEDGIPLG